MLQLRKANYIKLLDTAPINYLVNFAYFLYKDELLQRKETAKKSKSLALKKCLRPLSSPGSSSRYVATCAKIGNLKFILRRSLLVFSLLAQLRIRCYFWNLMKNRAIELMFDILIRLNAV